jgi:hypothetical protein
MSDLGDRLRSLDLLRLVDVPRLHALADEADRLERELFDALHAPQVSDPYQAGYDMGMRVAAEFQEQARAAREVSVEVIKDRDLILDAKMKLDLRVEELTRDATVSRALLDEFIANPRDEYHTMAELYEYRMLYNAYAALYFDVMHRAAVKSWKHHDGEPCFDGYYFIVCLWTTEGMVTNHYKREDWALFTIPEVETAPEWDGHSSQEAARRLRVMLEDTE